MRDIRLEPFKAEHLKGVDWGTQGWLMPYFDEIEAGSSYSRSAYAGDIFLGSGGVAEVHEFRAVAWVVLVPGQVKLFRQLYNLVKKVLSVQIYPRIEAYIDPEFSQAMRMVKMLGFRQEGEYKPYFFPDGRTGSEWVIIRGE